MGAAMGGMPPQGGGEQPSEMYVALRDLLNEIRMNEQDEQDLLDLEKIGTIVQGLLARNQKEAQDAMQGKLSPRMLSQAYGA